MTGHRGRKVHVVEVGGTACNAYSTSIEFSLTLDDLMQAIALAATVDGPADRRFQGALSHNPVANESYWSEADARDAVAIAAKLGPRHIYSAARAGLRAHGEGWRSQDWGDVFPREAARRRAEELFPMLRQEGNPFAPTAGLTDL